MVIPDGIRRLSSFRKRNRFLTFQGIPITSIRTIVQCSTHATSGCVGHLESDKPSARFLPKVTPRDGYGSFSPSELFPKASSRVARHFGTASSAQPAADAFHKTARDLCDFLPTLRCISVGLAFVQNQTIWRSSEVCFLVQERSPARHNPLPVAPMPQRRRLRHVASPSGLLLRPQCHARACSNNGRAPPSSSASSANQHSRGRSYQRAVCFKSGVQRCDCCGVCRFAFSAKFPCKRSVRMASSPTSAARNRSVDAMDAGADSALSAQPLSCAQR